MYMNNAIIPSERHEMSLMMLYCSLSSSIFTDVSLSIGKSKRTMLNNANSRGVASFKTNSMNFKYSLSVKSFRSSSRVSGFMYLLLSYRYIKDIK